MPQPPTFLLPLATWISKIDYNKHRLGNPKKWNCQLFSLLGKKYVKLEVFLHLPVLSNIQAMRTYALRRSKIRVKHSLLNIAIYLEWVLPLQSLYIQRSRKTRLGLWDPICLLRPFLLYHFSNPFLCICHPFSYVMWNLCWISYLEAFLATLNRLHNPCWYPSTTGENWE